MDGPVQPFPKDGLLANNLNLTLSQLAKGIGKTQEAAYSYIVASVKSDRAGGFEQRGSAPNFQGGYLTLCTCKHQMRSRVKEWEGKWIAGLTSRCRYQKRHWLFFLTRIEAAYESHADLWMNLPSATKAAKSAQGNFLGDLFVPQGKVVGEDRFNPRRYFVPSRHSHRRSSCDNGWHRDIDYKGRRPSLLLGDPHLTFLWQKPVISFDNRHCRDYRKWESVTDLFSHLIDEEP